MRSRIIGGVHENLKANLRSEIWNEDLKEDW